MDRKWQTREYERQISDGAPKTERPRYCGFDFYFCHQWRISLTFRTKQQ